MSRLRNRLARTVMLSLCALVSGVLPIGPAQAAIEGITGPTFTLTAKAGYISTGDGQNLLAYGYANGAGEMQYPGPTLIVDQGDTITITLINQLPAIAPDAAPNVSIVFPGQENVSANPAGNPASTAQGNLTLEARPTGSVTYTFVASQPGTYLYHSGTDTALQVEMGLTGALIVRPNVGDPLHRAYGHEDSRFDREYLFFQTEMDINIHRLVELGARAMVDFSTYRPTLWFFNGRNAPDSMSDNYVAWLPTQPYGSMAMMHPGEKVLLRLVGGGRDFHPFHHHGNNTWLIAKDGRLLQSASNSGPDLAVSNFTITIAPGETYDATFEWTGQGLGFDIYGHAPGDPMAPNEDGADHGKPLPTVLPDFLSVTIGGFYSGSPFIGQVGALPPGQGGLNPNGAVVFMWHSHTERELTNDDIFPGGAMAMMMIEHPDVPLP